LVRLTEDLPEAQALMSIPNLSPITAAIFLGSTGDPQAYSSGWEVVRLAGLTLVEASSGTHKGMPRISKRGRPALRAMAFMFVLRNITEGGFLRARYQRHLKHNGDVGMKAMVAVMRYALRLMFARARARREFTIRRPAQVA
jgi:transposase